MNKNIKAIIFDFGNVFIKWDAGSVYKRFFPDRASIDAFLDEINFLEWNMHQDAGRPFKEGVAALSKEFPQYAHLIKAYDTHWEDSFIKTIDGTIEIINELKKQGWSLHMLTNFSVEKWCLIRPKHAFLDLFETITVSGEHKLIKPDPEIFKLALRNIGQRAENCLFIDDSPANIAAARKLGFHTIQFQSAKQLKRELKEFTNLGYDNDK